MPARMELDFEFKKNSKLVKKHGDNFNILIMGDFSGKNTLDSLTVKKVDLDNFERIFSRIKPSLQIDLSEPYNQTLSLVFNEFEDFHPDQLFQNLECFSYWKALREKLHNSASYEEAAQQLKQKLGLSVSQTEEEFNGSKSGDSTNKPSETPQGGSLLDQLLDKRTANLSEHKTDINKQSGQIQSFMEKIIAPHVEPGQDPDRQRLVGLLDSQVQGLMRAILHHPEFQALESNWRALFECVTRLELDESLKLNILDISKEALESALSGGEESPLYQILVEQSVNTLEGEPWSVIGGLYYFDATDCNVLSRLAVIAASSGASFLSSPHNELLSNLQTGSIPAWEQLRGSSAAGNLAMVLPRMIGRQSYGANTDEIDSFEFEEMDSGGQPNHEDFLWLNSVAACLLLLGQTYTENGWNMRPGQQLDLADLAYHTYSLDDETQMKPCAEIAMSETEGGQLLSMGFMPLLSYKNRNAVRLMCFQSLAGEGLVGPWDSN